MNIFVNIKKNKYWLLLLPFLFLVLQAVMLDANGGTLSEGWFSDVAYHLNSQLSGSMAKDIPWGAGWVTGIGKLYFLIHHAFYNVFGVGLFQARMVTFLSGIILLAFVFMWTRKYISKDVAIFSTFLLAMSPLLAISLLDARQDVMHCLFAFISFYFISSAILDQKNTYFILAGLFGAMSVDISYRGIEIAMAVYLFNCVFFKRGAFLKRSVLLLLGSGIAFIYWVFENILPMGIDNFLRYQLAVASGDGGAYSIWTLFSEVIRFSTVLTNRYFLPELIFLAIFLGVFYRYRENYKRVSRPLILWLAITFILMSLIEKTSYRQYLLIYYPVLYVLSGIGMVELLKNSKKLAYVILILFVIYAAGFQLIRFNQYAFHRYIVKDFDLQGYYHKLRTSVDLNRNIIGTTNHWYAFPDSQYYGGQFYLERVRGILKEIKRPGEYINQAESAKALLSVFKKRKIEYIIACEYFKPTIACYFPNNELPSRNFLLIKTITDKFLGGDYHFPKPLYRTEIYKIVSYER